MGYWEGKDYFSFYPNLLAEAHLLEPLLGDGGPGRKLRVADIGAGKGIDSVVLSLLGHQIVALEQDSGELQLMWANQMLNNVSFPVLEHDLTTTDITGSALLAANGGQPFDVIVANGMTYAPREVFSKLLDLVEYIGSQDFVWLWTCGKEVALRQLVCQVPAGGF